jgi:Family of unknown function (DUF6074)
MFRSRYRRMGVAAPKHEKTLGLPSTARAEVHLSQQLKVQADTLRRKGVAEPEIAREIRSLESAIRTALWRIVFAIETPEQRR